MASQRSIWTKRLSPTEETAHRDAAFAAIKRLYAEAVALWTFCKRGACRRHHRCCAADRHVCLLRAWPLLSRAQRDDVFLQVQAGGAQRLPPASPVERELRRYPPSNFVH
jgi:hypothetical protein